MTHTRAYARNKEQAQWLKSHGLPDKAIYLQGRGAEDLDECLASFRGRVGKLIIAHDLRVFGEAKKDVAAVMTRLEKARIRVVDVSHPGDTTIAEMVQRASIAISGTRFRDRRTAKRMGRAGGLGRGIGAQNLREGFAPTWLVNRIVDAREIRWPLKVELLAPHFTQATLRRHYGANATARKP